MQADDPAYLSVGTAVSAKYKGAFCEAKVSKVVRIVKCKVTYKMGLGTATVSDEQIKGPLRVGHTVQAKHSEKKEFVEATITKIQDCSQYTVVFDDGDITTLRRSALCLKSGRHFNESETLDQLPLTHPEHFGNPVVGGRRGRRNRQLRDDSSEGEPEEENEPDLEGYSIDIGRVVSVEATDKKRGKDNWFPGLVVIPSAQPTVRINVKDEYLVRSFKDGRYYTVPKKEVTEFNRDSGEKVESTALEEAVNKAIKYLDNNELPVHWERNSLFNMQSIDSDSDENYSNSSDDEPNEEKDRFVAQLYKFMDDSGTPLNKTPLIANKDVDLHRMFRVVQKLGGYNRVTNKNKWRLVTTRLKLPNNHVTYNQVKNVYKKCLSSYETFYKTLGVTMINHSLTTKKNRGRSLIRDKDRATPVSSSPKPEKEEEIAEKKEEEKSSSDEKSKKKEKEIKKEVSRKEFVENSDTSTSSDTTDQSESREGIKGRRLDKPKEKKKAVAEKVKKEEETGQQTRSKAQSKKELPIAKKEIKPADVSKTQKPQKKSDDDKKRGRKKIGDEKASVEIVTETAVNIGDKLKVYYGPTHEHKVTYEAKVVDVDKDSTGLVYLVHYTGWNTRYDEWISPTRIAENLSANTKAKRLKQSTQSAKNTKSSTAAKRGRGVTLANRGTATDMSAAPPPRSTTPSSVTSSSSRTKSPATTRSMRNTRLDSHRKTRRASAHTDISNHSEESDSDVSGSESEVSSRTTRSAEPRTYKRKIIKKGKEKDDEEDNEKRRTRKGTKKSPEKSEESDEDAISNLPKGRDFDLNQIRSELKGFNKAVKIPLDSSDKEASSSSEDVVITQPEPEEEQKEIKSEDLTAEDIYEFKEPEPFEFEPRPKTDDKTAKKRIPRLFEKSPDQQSPELDKKRSKKEDDPFDKLAESPSYNLGRITETHDKSFGSPIEEGSEGMVAEGSLFSKYSRNLELEFYEDVKKEKVIDAIRECVSAAIEGASSSDEENLTEDEDLTSVKKKEDVVMKVESLIKEESLEAKCEEKEEPKHSFIHTPESSKLLETFCPKTIITSRVEESKELSMKTGTRIADSLLQKLTSVKSKSEEEEDSESEIEDQPKIESEKEVVKNEIPPVPSVVETQEIKCKPCVEPEIKKLSPLIAPSPKTETIESTKKKRKVVSRAYIDDSDSNSSDSEQLVIAKFDDDSQTNSTTEKTELKESDSETSPPNAATTDDSESQEQRNFKFDEQSEISETLPEEPSDVVKEDEPDSQLHSLLLCEETIPRSPAPAPESSVATSANAASSDNSQKSKKTSPLEMPFASAPGTCASNITKNILLSEHSKQVVAKVQPAALVLPSMAGEREVSNVITPPSTPGSSSSGDHGDFSPNTIENESCKSNDAELDYPRKRRNSSVNKSSLYSEDDTQMANESTSGKKLREESSLPATCRKRRKSTRGNDDVPPKRGRKPLNRSRHNSDSDDTSEHSLTGSASLALSNYETRTAKSPRPLKYNFFVEFDPSLNSGQRIAVLQQKLSELRKTYAEVKAELAAVERRRKKIRRREREALKASKQELVCG